MTQRYVARLDSKRTPENYKRIWIILSKWTENWQLAFYSDKCKVMHIVCNQGARYYIKVKEIQSTKEERDFGVWVTSDLKSIQAKKMLWHTIYVMKALDCITVFGVAKF